LIKPNQIFEVGDSVIADIRTSPENPVMSLVAAVSQDAILLATQDGYSQVNTEQVRGRVVVLFPYFGKVANLFN
jgi:hypothetical protein